MGKLSVVCLFLLVIFQGCATVNVREGTGKNNGRPGIPFYIKKGVCTQTSIWLKPIYTLTLTKVDSRLPASGNGKKQQSPPSENEEIIFQVSESVILDLCRFNDSAVTALRSRLSEKDISIVDGARDASTDGMRATTQNDEIEKIWSEVKDLPNHPCRKQIQSEYLAKDSAVQGSYVDYSTTFYLNAKRPLIGTSNVQAELNADQTLSKGSVAIESKEIETFLSLLPVNPLLRKSLDLPPEEAAAVQGLDGGGAQKLRVTRTLKIELVTNKYTLAKRYYVNPCVWQATLPIDQASLPAGSCLRADEYELEVVKSPEEPKEKEEGDKITVSGTILLPAKPKEEDAEKDKEKEKP